MVERIGDGKYICRNSHHYDSNDAVKLGVGKWKFTCPGCGEITICQINETDVLWALSNPFSRGEANPSW